MTPDAPAGPLIANPVPSGSFARLWTAYTANVAGDEFYALAVPLIIYQIGGTASSMSFVYSCILLPQVIMGFLGGVLADRSDRVKALRACFALAAISLLGAFLLFSTVLDISIAAFAFIAIALGVSAPVAAACFDSAVPYFVEPARLSRANASTEASRTVCVVAGPAAAGFAITHLAPEYAVLLNSVSFAVSFLLLHRMRAPLQHQGEKAPATANSHWQDLIAGLRYLAHQNVIRAGILVSTVVNLAFGAYEPMVVYRMRDDLGLSSQEVGIVFAIVGATSIGTALLLSWKAPSRHFLSMMGLAVALQGLAVASVALSPNVALMTAGQITFISGMIVYTVCWRAMRQTIVPAHLLGRVAGACRSVAYAGSFLGSLVSALVLDHFVEVSTALLVAGILVIAVGTALLVFAVPTRERLNA